MLHCHHRYKTIIIRQIERFLIVASLFELIFDSGHDGFKCSWRLEFEDSEEDHEYLAPLEMVEFCKTISPVLPSIGYLASRDELSRIYHFFNKLGTIIP